MHPTVELLKQLMEFRAVSSDVERVNASVEFLRRYLSRAGVYTRVERLGKRKILYGATRKTKSPSILFNAHLDVVPADDETFRFRERNGWIWGRGSGDCLGNCAVLARTLISCRDRADAGAIFTTDEESSGATTAHMVEKGYRGKLILVLDTTGADFEMATAHKGMLTLKLIATGKSCHGSSPWLGVNAIDRLIEGYNKVKALFPPVKPGNEWHTTCSCNMISAGTVFNRVPDRAEMVLDIRHTGSKASAKVLTRRIATVSGLKVEVLTSMPVVRSDARHPILRELRRFLAAHLKRRIDLKRLNAATDARHFVALNAPIAMMGIPYRNPHASNERAHIKGMLLFQKTIEDLCKQGLPGLNEKHG